MDLADSQNFGTRGRRFSNIQRIRLVCEFENAFSRQHSLSVRVTRYVQSKLDLLLFRTPLRHLALPEILWDLAIQLVCVGLIHATTHREEPLIKSFAPRNNVVSNSLLVTIEGGFNARYNVIWDRNVLQNVAQLLRNFFFTEIRSAALPTVSAATIVDVLPLFEPQPSSCNCPPRI
jgi:hypothetical protein